jgi:hydrogenase maturation protease
MKTLVIGLGNTLAQDDGAGIVCVEKMQGMKNFENIDMLLCFTDLLKLMNWYENQERVIIIDAIDAKLPAGSVICLKEKGLFSFENLSRSAHQISALESLKLLKLVLPGFDKCEIFFIGIQIKNTGLHGKISGEVEESTDLIINILKNILSDKN